MALVTVSVSHITGLILVDPATDTDIGPLVPGQSVPASWNVRADALSTVTRVVFAVRRDGVLIHSRNEGVRPFALCGDSNPPGDYAACSISNGPATITATPMLDTVTGTPLSIDIIIGQPTSTGEPFSDGTFWTDGTGWNA